MIYYWRKIVKTFAADDDGNVTKVEIDCLQKRKKNILSDPKGWTRTERNTQKRHRHSRQRIQSHILWTRGSHDNEKHF